MPNIIVLYLCLTDNGSIKVGLQVHMKQREFFIKGNDRFTWFTTPIDRDGCVTGLLHKGQSRIV